MFKTASHGGDGGHAWDDLETLGAPPAGFHRIRVRSGTLVDKLETSYALEGGGATTLNHGGPGGNPADTDFVPREILIGIKGRSGTLVDQLSFVTAVIYGGGDPPLIRTSEASGGNGGAPFEIWGDIAAFHGRSGTLIDAIGCYLRTETVGPFGGSGGEAFQDPGPVPELSRIESMIIRSGSFVDSISTIYRLPDGSRETFSHGGGGGTRHLVSFVSGEQIIAVVGRAGTYLDNIAFLTEDPQGVRRTHGPFGGDGGSPFIVNRKVNGFFGRSGAYIDQIGFFVS
jgi:hypothetical protein